RLGPRIGADIGNARRPLVVLQLAGAMPALAEPALDRPPPGQQAASGAVEPADQQLVDRPLQRLLVMEQTDDLAGIFSRHDPRFLPLGRADSTGTDARRLAAEAPMPDRSRGIGQFACVYDRLGPR